MNTSKLLLRFYQRRLSRNISSGPLHKTGIYTVKFEKECTGSRRQEYLTISNWSEDCNPGGTHYTSTHQARGGKHGDRSHFNWWLMTLGSNILESNMQNTF